MGNERPMRNKENYDVILIINNEIWVNSTKGAKTTDNRYEDKQTLLLNKYYVTSEWNS